MAHNYCHNKYKLSICKEFTSDKILQLYLTSGFLLSASPPPPHPHTRVPGHLLE